MKMPMEWQDGTIRYDAIETKEGRKPKSTSPPAVEEDDLMNHYYWPPMYFLFSFSRWLACLPACSLIFAMIRARAPFHNQMRK